MANNANRPVDMPKLKGISLRQPWAEAIICGLTAEEYGGTPTKNRGAIYIYASLGDADPDDVADWEREHGIDTRSFPRGVVIGTVEIVDCYDNGEWFAWVLENPRRLPTPVRPVERPQPVWFHPFGRP